VTKDHVIAFSIEEEKTAAKAPLPDSQLRYSVLLQGTFSSAEEREDFLQAFSHTGLKVLSSANYLRHQKEKRHD